MVEHLIRLTGDEEGVWGRVRAGEVLLSAGGRVSTVHGGTPYAPGATAYLYRDLPHEVRVPGEVRILLREDQTGLLAVDKPPFLATMPRGAHVVQTEIGRAHV